MAHSRRPDRRLAATCLAYVAYFAAAGIGQPYFPIWLDSRGLGEAQIAALLSIPMLCRIVFGPLVGWLADRLGRQDHVLRILLATTLVAAIWCSLPVRDAAMLPVFALMIVAWQGVSRCSKREPSTSCGRTPSPITGASACGDRPASSR